MKRFFGRKESENTIIIEEDEFFHLKKVLRMKEGDNIIACINDENDYYCTIKNFDKNFCRCEIDKVEKNVAITNRDITLFQMLPKKEYLDSIIPKSIELGVNEIYFFTSEWTMIKSIKEERVKQQILSACKQCERSRLLEVNPLLKFDEMVEKLKEYDLVVFPYENEEVENKFNPDILNGKQKIAVVVGNEAGFSEKEALKIKSEKVSAISLGTRILRCDTAVTSILALVSILSNN